MSCASSCYISCNPSNLLQVHDPTNQPFSWLSRCITTATWAAYINQGSMFCKLMIVGLKEGPLAGVHAYSRRLSVILVSVSSVHSWDQLHSSTGICTNRRPLNLRSDNLRTREVGMSTHATILWPCHLSLAPVQSSMQLRPTTIMHAPPWPVPLYTPSCAALQQRPLRATP